MLWQSKERWILAYSEAIDMRCSFDGLVTAVKRHMNEDPLSGNFFIFLNRRKTLLKAVFWDRTGWCVFAKRLERGRFGLRNGESKQELSHQELGFLLDGIVRKSRR